MPHHANISTRATTRGHKSSDATAMQYSNTCSAARRTKKKDGVRGTYQQRDNERVVNLVPQRNGPGQKKARAPAVILAAALRENALRAREKEIRRARHVGRINSHVSGQINYPSAAAAAAPPHDGIIARAPLNGATAARLFSLRARWLFPLRAFLRAFFGEFCMYGLF